VVGTINNRNIAQVCGVPVYCLGAEKASQVAKIQGSSLKYCYGDEIAKWNQKVFAMVQSRLDKEYSCMDGACNPENPSHWLKGFIDREDIDTYIQKYTIFDNPFLPKSFVDNLCKEYAGTVYYGRYIDGEWTLAEGLIYPMYADAITSDLPGKYSEYAISIDYGTQNAFAALLWGLNNGVWYAFRGYYYSGRSTGIQKTDSEYLRDLEMIFGDIIEKYYDDLEKYEKEPYWYDMPRKIETIIDPSAASFIALLKKRGWCKVRPAINDVENGIRDTAVAMQSGKIKVSDKIKEWADEMGGYVWDDKSEDEKPVKVNDHYADSTRYFVETKRIVKPIRDR
jgi:PBSX family phage terminase large subunit